MKYCRFQLSSRPHYGLVETVAGREEITRLLVSAPEVTAVARQLLPYTGRYQADLTAGLDAAVSALARAKPGWWRASPAELTTMADIDAVRRALEDAGVLFLDANHEGPGVRLRQQE